MEKWFLSSLWLFLPYILIAQNIAIKDAASDEPIAFATVEFSNGYGTFADDNGIFRFSTKLYKDVDTLNITALGYRDYKVAAAQVPTIILMTAEASLLQTVVINAQLTGDFYEEEIKPQNHDRYPDTWQPTVESEIAVLFKRVDSQPTQIKNVKLPVLVEESQKGKKGARRRFSTMFRIQFYDIEEDGSPVARSSYPTKTFVVTQETGDLYEVDIENLNITIPKRGLFAGIQVLGFTKPDGELVNSKKYREVKTKRGIVKVSTAYRPLLPFVKQSTNSKIYVRRIFHNDKQWQQFDLKYNPLSKLVRSGNTYYGMGADLKVYRR